MLLKGTPYPFDNMLYPKRQYHLEWEYVYKFPQYSCLFSMVFMCEWTIFLFSQFYVVLCKRETRLATEVILGWYLQSITIHQIRPESFRFKSMMRKGLASILHIVAGTKWPTFSRRHFHMHIRESIYDMRLRFNWSLFLSVQLTIFQHWFR